MYSSKTPEEREENLEQAKKEIEKAKAKLKRRAKKNGMSENFGQKKVRELSDKYHYPTYDNPELDEAISDFREWTMNYVPER